MSASPANHSALDTDLLSLRSFIAVVEEGGFSAAAKRIHRTQSAVSLQIAKLEDRLGTSLLTRNTRSVSLTPPGEIFLSYARRIIELADEAAFAVTAPDEPTHLRVGFADYLAPHHLHTLLASFRRAHPNCDISLILGMGADLLPKLENDQLDLLLAGPEGSDGTILWEEPLVWAGNLPSAPTAPLNLVLMPSPCVYRRIAFDSLTRAGLPWKLSIEVNSVHAVRSAIQAGLGISILPHTVLGDDLPRIHNLLPEIPDTALHSYTPRGSNHPYAQRFVDFLLASKDDFTPSPPKPVHHTPATPAARPRGRNPIA